MDLEATAAERCQLEYTTQLFEFTPDAFVDTITAPSIDIINSKLDVVKDKFGSEFVGKVTEKQLDDSFTIIKDGYGSHARYVLDKFGRYVNKNILSVPKNVVLPEDRAHVAHHDYKSDNFDDDMKRIDNLRRDIQNAKYSRAILKAKLANLQLVRAKQENMIDMADAITAEKKMHDSILDPQINLLKDGVKSLTPIIERFNKNVETLRRKGEPDDVILAKMARIDKENIGQ